MAPALLCKCRTDLNTRQHSDSNIFLCSSNPHWAVPATLLTRRPFHASLFLVLSSHGTLHPFHASLFHVLSSHIWIPLCYCVHTSSSSSSSYICAVGRCTVCVILESENKLKSCQSCGSCQSYLLIQSCVSRADGDPRELCPPAEASLPHLPDPPRTHLPPGQAGQPAEEEGGDPCGHGPTPALR